MDEFDDRYRRAYGRHLPQGEYRVRHGEEELRFGREHDQAAPLPAPTPAPADATAVRAAPTPAETEAAAERRRRYVDRQPVDAQAWSRRDDDVERTERRVRYPRVSEERVIERRPMVEEVVVRRREADASEQDSLLERGPDDAPGPRP